MSRMRWVFLKEGEKNWLHIQEKVRLEEAEGQNIDFLSFVDFLYKIQMGRVDGHQLSPCF